MKRPLPIPNPMEIPNGIALSPSHLIPSPEIRDAPISPAEIDPAKKDWWEERLDLTRRRRSGEEAARELELTENISQRVLIDLVGRLESCSVQRIKADLTSTDTGPSIN
jgi:hypothetical protein